MNPEENATALLSRLEELGARLEMLRIALERQERLGRELAALRRLGEIERELATAWAAVAELIETKTDNREEKRA